MNNTKKRITIYVTKKNYTDLQVIAQLNDLSVSNVINRLFADYIKSSKAKPIKIL